MSITRRSFIKRSLITGAVVATGKGCGNDVEPAPIIEVGLVDDMSNPRYGQVSVPLPRYPELAGVGGAVTIHVVGAPGERSFTIPEKGILLIHRGTPEDPPEFVATRADCPHQGCPLGYSPHDGLIECPCHSSRFRAVTDPNDEAQCAGLVVHPPAQANLRVYEVKRAGDWVHIDLRTDLSCDVKPLPPVDKGRITIPLADFPALAQVGGSVVGSPEGLGDTILVARVSTERVICLSRECTHRRCDVQLDATAGLIRCPCHGSQFSYEGQVLNPPATAPLKTYEVMFDVDGSSVVVLVPE